MQLFSNLFLEKLLIKRLFGDPLHALRPCANQSVFSQLKMQQKFRKYQSSIIILKALIQSGTNCLFTSRAQNDAFKATLSHSMQLFTVKGLKHKWKGY